MLGDVQFCCVVPAKLVLIAFSWQRCAGCRRLKPASFRLMRPRQAGHPVLMWWAMPRVRGVLGVAFVRVADVLVCLFTFGGLAACVKPPLVKLPMSSRLLSVVIGRSVIVGHSALLNGYGAAVMTIGSLILHRVRLQTQSFRIFFHTSRCVCPPPAPLSSVFPPFSFRVPFSPVCSDGSSSLRSTLRRMIATTHDLPWLEISRAFFSLAFPLTPRFTWNETSMMA